MGLHTLHRDTDADIFCCYLCVFNVNFVVIQNISASFSELFPNYAPVPLCLEKWGGGHDPPLPPAPMGAPPLQITEQLQETDVCVNWEDGTRRYRNASAAE